MAFDEYDPETMIPLVKLMLEFATEIFPSTLEANGQVLHRRLAYGKGIHLEQSVAIVNNCMGPLYVAHKGKGWKKQKEDELREIGLLFIWYALEDFPKMGALVVCKLVDEHTLYLYEIQVLPEYQSHKWGSKLMDSFHALAKKLDETSLNDTELDETLRMNCTTEYTGLTVFPDNERALKWYKQLGYTFSPNSPRDRKTRLRVIKPDYYELEREVD